MIILSIGSNLPSIWGNRSQTLTQSIDELESHSIRVVKQSAPYFSPPMSADRAYTQHRQFEESLATDFGLPEHYYINITLQIICHKPPEQLLYCLKTIETAAGRTTGQRWASRPLDMDIIDYNGRICGNDGEYNHKLHTGFLPLALPHPGVINRKFVLEPLKQIAPFWHHPINGKTAAQLLNQLN